MSMIVLSLPVVCALPLPAASGVACRGRFAVPAAGPGSDDWQRLDRDLPADHLARTIDRAVDQLDLGALFQSYGGTGSRAHRPDRLLKVVLFEMQRGRRSPAQWHLDLLENGPCQWLGHGLRPSRSRLYAFRERLGGLLDRWHQQIIALAVAEGVTDAKQASLDGSTVAAQASRHQLHNQERLSKKLALLDEALAADAQGLVAPTQPGWMAHSVAGRQQQHKRWHKASTQLQQRQADNRKRPASKRLQSKDVRISLSDPEAALGQDKEKVYRPLYNVQFMPDLKSRLILAYQVFAQASDAGTLPTMLERCKQATGRYPDDVLADASYATALDLAACEQARVKLYAPYQENDQSADRRAANPPKQIPKEAFRWEEAEQVYVCPQGHRLVREYSELVKRKGTQEQPQPTLRVFTYRCPPEHCQACPRQKECARCPHKGRTIKRSEHEALVEALKERMKEEQAKQLYRRRGQTVELSFADAKKHRGLRRFSGRGLRRVRIEVGLLVLAHNVLEVLAARDRKAEGRHDANPETPSS